MVYLLFPAGLFAWRYHRAFLLTLELIMKYQIAVSVVGEGTKTIVADTRKQAARIAFVFAWTAGYQGDENWFYLTSLTSSTGWNKSDRSLSVTVCRLP